MIFWRPLREGFRYSVAWLNNPDGPAGDQYQRLAENGKTLRFWTRKSAAKKCNEVNDRLGNDVELPALFDQIEADLKTNGGFCPGCEKQGTRPIRYSTAVHPASGGPSFTAHDLEGDECPHCGETFVDWNKARRNEERFNRAREGAGKKASPED